jgi:hypothetical protein
MKHYPFGKHPRCNRGDCRDGLTRRPDGRLADCRACEQHRTSDLKASGQRATLVDIAELMAAKTQP